MSLKVLCTVEPSDHQAIILHNGSTPCSLTYKQFYNLHEDLRGRIEEIVAECEGVGGYIGMGVYSDVRMELAVVVFTLLQLDITFVPLVMDCSPRALISVS